MQKLFGTDGIRGQAGEFPLDNQTVNVIGSALSKSFRERIGRDPKFITGRDTRESGPYIESSFHSGAAVDGAQCESAGVITTPGIAFLTDAFDFDAGIVISASHNPYEDNGIKIFAPDGKKIDEATENAIERAVFANQGIPADSIEVSSQRSGAFCQAYLEHLLAAAGEISLSGTRIVIDCANGAASWLAPQLFEATHADVITMNDEPDGQNINRDCGSLHLDGLAKRVVEESADIGVAFDGDADRALFVDEKGTIVDGDATLWVMAQYLKDHDKLKNSTVVATVMSNIGLEIALNSRSIDLIRAKVGDKYVLQSLLETGSEIGGEQSGHIIFPEISLVGDGMMTALLLLRAINERKEPLSRAADGFVRYPQILLNVPVRQKIPFDQVPEIARAAKMVEQELNGGGRLLLRYSGTERLARVMIEGKDQNGIEELARKLADVISSSLG